MEIVVKIEHLPIVFRLPSPFERLDDLEEHLEALRHRKVFSNILGFQKATAADLLGLPKTGLDQATGGVRALHESAALIGQNAETIQLVEELTGPVGSLSVTPTPHESGRPVIFLRPELVMKMGDQRSAVGRFGFRHFSSRRSLKKRGGGVVEPMDLAKAVGPEKAVGTRVITTETAPQRNDAARGVTEEGVPREPGGSTVFATEPYVRRGRHPLNQRILTGLAFLVTAACASDPPALTVGGVTFSETELLGLSDARRARLAEITAFGLATAREELPLKLAPMLDQARDAALLKQFVAERVLAESGVDDDQLRAHYLTNPRVELTVRHVLFFSERWRPASHREVARKKAEAAIARLEAGERFPEVAAELSEEPGAEGRQGLLQPGREGSWVSEFWGAALALEPGEISPVTETQYGFHVLRLEDRQIVPFEEARPAVVARVSALIGSTEDTAAGASLEDARASAIVVPEAVLAAISRDFEDRTFRWSTALGFAPGLTDAQVKEVARAALGATAQLATIARNELRDVGPLLQAAYPITYRDDGETETREPLGP